MKEQQNYKPKTFIHPRTMMALVFLVVVCEGSILASWAFLEDKLAQVAILQQMKLKQLGYTK